MIALFTYFRSDPDTKIKVFPHLWAARVVVLQVYRPKRILFFRIWKCVDSIGIDWPPCRSDLDKEVSTLFIKNSQS